MVEYDEEERQNEASEEDVSLAQGLEKSLRQGSFNAVERLQCSLLIESITSTPIDSIVYIMRSALMSDPATADKIGLNMDTVNHLYRVAIALQNAVEYTQGEVKIYDVETGSLDWKTDLNPWVKGVNYGGLRGADEPTIDELLEEGRTSQEIFEITCRRLSEHGFKHMISDFLIYSTPQAQEISKKIASKISSSTYSDLFKVTKQYQYRKFEE